MDKIRIGKIFDGTFRICRAPDCVAGKIIAVINPPSIIISEYLFLDLLEDKTGAVLELCADDIFIRCDSIQELETAAVAPKDYTVWHLPHPN